MSADYIHSAELVNTRYPRQTVVAILLWGKAQSHMAVPGTKSVAQATQTA
jgi:hypothetical protein